MIRKIETITPRESVASAARNCYSKKYINQKETILWHSKNNNTDNLIKDLLYSGHNTTFEHYYFTLHIEGYSRHFIWRYLHGLTDFYSTDQQSQRYVDLSNNSNFYMPSFLTNEDIKKWKHFYKFCLEEYEMIKDELSKKINKKESQEIARYILPIGQTPHLTYTINLMTAIRFIALGNLVQEYYSKNNNLENIEIPSELIKFSNELLNIIIEEKYNIYNYMKEIRKKLKEEIFHFSEEIKSINIYNNDLKQELQEKEKLYQILVKKLNLLENYIENYETLIFDLINIEKKKIDLSKFYNYKIKNNLLNINNNNIDLKVVNVCNFVDSVFETPNFDYNFYPLIKGEKSLINFTTIGKISHSADSQNQRHRTTNKIRPLIKSFYNDLKEKYYIPDIIKKYEYILDIYKFTVSEIYKFFEEQANKYGFNNVLYLLPNAQFVFIIDNDNMEYFTHKAEKRLCFNSQEEIWNFTYKQIKELENFNINTEELNLRPPCHNRKKFGIKPYCSEGKRFCGIKVWKIDFNNLKRII